jgi:hypothetical protein
MSRTRSVLATLLVACLVGACSDDDPKPDIADPTPSAPSSLGSTTTSASVTPSTTLSPEDTVRAWIQARNRALSDGDTSDVDALSAPDCRSCEELNKVINEVYGAGGHFETTGWTIDSIQEKAGSQPVQVDTALTFAAGQTVPSAGADPVSYDEEKHIVSFRLKATGGSYRVQLVLFR